MLQVKQYCAGNLASRTEVGNREPLNQVDATVQNDLGCSLPISDKPGTTRPNLTKNARTKRSRVSKSQSGFQRTLAAKDLPKKEERAKAASSKTRRAKVGSSACDQDDSCAHL
jgi:hypothetical protein